MKRTCIGGELSRHLNHCSISQGWHTAPVYVCVVCVAWFVQLRRHSLNFLANVVFTQLGKKNNMAEFKTL